MTPVVQPHWGLLTVPKVGHGFWWVGLDVHPSEALDLVQGRGISTGGYETVESR